MTSASPPQDLTAALRAWRLAAERALLGLAYADVDPGAGPPPPLPDPGGWPGLLDVLLTGEAAQALARRDLEPRLVAVVELARVEAAEVGPPGGILRGRPCPARARVEAEVGPLSPGWIADAHRLAPRLPSSFTSRLPSLPGVELVRLAAADAWGAARWTTDPPLAVDGAPGWGVVVVVEPLLGGGWIATARRRWLGIIVEPIPPPRIEVTWFSPDGTTTHPIPSTRSESAWLLVDLPAPPRVAAYAPGAKP